MQGGLAILLIPISTWYLFTALDFIIGQNNNNPDLETQDSQLFWYRFITLLWPPLQIVTVFGILAYVTASGHLNLFEQWALFAALGVLSGTIGIVYAHELMHQKNRLERWLADLLMTSVLYGHFRSEHLLVHHRYVGTPRDPVTARFGESFYHFFFRVLRTQPPSAFRAEPKNAAPHRDTRSARACSPASTAAPWYCATSACAGLRYRQRACLSAAPICSRSTSSATMSASR